MYRIDETEFPLDMRFKAGVNTLNTYLAAHIVQLYETFGDEGLKLIRKVWSDMADKFFLNSFRKLGFTGNGPKELAEWFAKADGLIGYDTDLLVVSERKAGFRINKCPWFDEPYPGGEKLCGEGVTGFERRAAALLNPKLQFSMPKCFHKGDGVCEFMFELPQE